MLKYGRQIDGSSNGDPSPMVACDTKKATNVLISRLERINGSNVGEKGDRWKGKWV